MNPPGRAPKTALLLVLTLLGFLPACSSLSRHREDPYNSWKERCYELASQFHKLLEEEIPYHPFAALGANHCSDPDSDYTWDVDRENLPIVMANFIYHYDIGVRRKAFEMLLAYPCATDDTCEVMAGYLNNHVAASLEDQKPLSWRREFEDKVRALRQKLRNDH